MNRMDSLLRSMDKKNEFTIAVKLIKTDNA